MRQFNTRFCVAFFLSVAIIGVLMVTAWVINYDRSLSHLLEAAEEAQTQGDTRLALENYRKYLLQNPDDSERVCDAANVAATFIKKERVTGKELFDAVNLMNSALLHSPGRNDIRRELIDFYVSFRDFNRAGSLIADFAQHENLSPELEFLAAKCASGSGEETLALERLNRLIGYDEASQVFDVTKAVAPHFISAYKLLAEIYWQRGDVMSKRFADEVMDQMVLANPESAEVFLLQGRYLLARTEGNAEKTGERLKLARQHLHSALKLDPDNHEVLLELATVAMQVNDFTKAREILANALKHAPEDPNVYLKLAQLAEYQGDTEGRLAQLQKGLKLLPEDPMLLSMLLEVQQANAMAEAARETLSRMEQLGLPQDQIEFARAKVLVVEGQWRAASELLESLRPKLAITDAEKIVRVDNLLGRCYGKLGQPDRQLDAFSRALLLDPTSRKAMAGRANTLVTLQQNDEALVAFRRLRSEMGSELFESIDPLRSRYENVLFKLGTKYQNENMLKELSEIRKRSITRRGETEIDQALITLRGLLSQGNLKESLRLLEMALEKYPSDPRLQRNYINVLVEIEGADEGLRQLTAAMSRPQDPWESAEHLLKQAQLTAMVGGPEVASRLRELEQKIAQYPEQIPLWQQFAQIYLRLDPPRSQDARRCMRRMVEVDRNSRYVAEVVFLLELEQDNEQGALEILDDVATRFGKETAIWRFMRARYLLWRYDQNPIEKRALDEIRSLSEEIAKTRPKWHRLLQLQTATFEREGYHDEAIRAYQDALKFGPADAETVGHLVNLLVDAGQFQKARFVLMQMDGPLSVSMARARVVLDVIMGNKDAATNRLNQMVPADSEVAQDLIWRGQTLRGLEKFEEAEQAFRRAVQLNPTLPQAWLMLIGHLVKSGRLADAEQEVRNAENRLSGIEAPLVLGKCYSLIKDNVMAEHYLRQALIDRPDDVRCQKELAQHLASTGNFQQAGRYLKSLIEQSVLADQPLDPLAQWSRRWLAKGLARKGGYQNFVRAMQLLEANRQKEGTLEIDDKRLKAQLLSERVEPLCRQLAVELYEEIPMDWRSDQDRLNLADLYDAMGDHRNSRTIIQNLLTQNPDNLQLLVNFIDYLIRRDEAEEAEVWVARLLAKAPQLPETAMLQARVAQLKGKSQDAIDKIEAALPTTTKPSDAPTLLHAARTYQNMGMYKQAEEKYRACAALDDRFQLTLAEFLAERGDVDDYFQIAGSLFASDRARNFLPILCKTGIQVAERYPDSMTPARLDQIETWIARAKKEFPDKSKPYEQQAALLALQGKLRQAVDMLYQVPLEDFSDRQRGQLVNNRAYLKLKLGQADAQSLKDINDAFRLIGRRAELLDTRAMIHLARGECSQAIQDLQEATMFGSTSPVYYLHLAVAQKCDQNRVEVEKALKQGGFLGAKPVKLDAEDQEQLDQLKKWLFMPTVRAK